MDLLHLGKEWNYCILVVDLVVFQIETLKVWKLEKLLACFSVWDQILLEIQVSKVHKAFKPFNFRNHVAR